MIYLSVICVSGTIEAQEPNLLVVYNFDSVADSSGTYTGSLQNGAELVDYNGIPVLKLGSENGYFDFGQGIGEIIASLDSFSISTDIMIPTSTNISQNGNFVWTFANSDNMAAAANGNMFLTAISTRYAISQTAWAAESNVNSSKALTKGKWINLTYTQKANTGNIYVDGVLWKSNSISLVPANIGSTSHNYLGKSCYLSDAYLKNAEYHNFRIYEGAISEADILGLCNSLPDLNNYNDSIYILEVIGEIMLADTDSVRSKLTLQEIVGNGVNVTWSSSDISVLSNNGDVTRPAQGADPISVNLTATFTYNNISISKVYTVIVLPKLSDQESVEFDLNNISIDGNVNNVRVSLKLPIVSFEGSRIQWTSNSPDYMNNVGRVIKLPPVGSGKKTVTLTATVINGTASMSKDFEVKIAEDEGKSAYLFTYFTGNTESDEQIRFATSYDGYNYTALNNGDPIIGSDTISIKNGVRDPHIMRCEDGNTFYMVVTDMKSSEGWSSNRGIVMLKSTDLVHWTHSTVHFPTKWPIKWSNVTRVWAPQTIYDPSAGKYMVYFSLLTNDGTVSYDKIYYCYANDDFTDLEGEPVFFYDRGSATIDGDIVYNETDSLYHLFYKNEGQGGICKVTSKTLTPIDGQPDGSQWSNPSDRLEQTNNAVEGVGVFRLINSDDWVMMYDVYSSGYYQYNASKDLANFSFVKNSTNLSARHGTTIPISEEELNRLGEAFPSSSFSNSPMGAREINIRQDELTIDNSTRHIEIPVRLGVDIKQYNPMLYASPGTNITPTGPQDFSGGPVKYYFTLNGKTVIYSVRVYIAVNPIIPDFHADPEILFSEKTQRYYIYPTTDGYPSWGGYSFDVFSSPDLVNWTNEGTILDLSTNQVSWASGNAWAPCIEEKKVGENEYRYYFYFSGESGGKKIGVAVANDPTGPFTDIGAPLISDLPSGVSSGQQIDVDVFTDSVSGKSYIYWGNGYMAVAELNDDMVSLKEGTTQVITPSGGSLSTFAYREGTYVFYRNGKYYFTWSVDDTGSPNYHVAYGTSDSPTGPITVADNPIVIIQEPTNQIYGTGHNSILKIPGRDEWYIIYHRINREYINNDPGIHREVCIDRLYFNEDGSIKQVVPAKLDYSLNKSQSIIFDDITEKAYSDPDFLLSAKSTSELDVTFISSDTNIIAITGSTATIVGTGLVTITAMQEGNAEYDQAEPVSKEVTVAKADQIITFSDIADKVVGDEPFKLTATSSSGLPLEYSSSNNVVATISGDILTILSAGTTNITASQAGNTNYNPATDVVKVLNVATTSIDLISEKNIAVKPNPVNGVLTITLKEQITEGAINIYSTNGNLVFYEVLEGDCLKIDMGSFQQGVYILKIKSSEGEFIKQIVKI